MSNTEEARQKMINHRYRGHRRIISSADDQIASAAYQIARMHRMELEEAANQMATDSDVIKYYDLQVKLGLYPHMRNIWFNGVEQCPSTQLMTSFHTGGNKEAIRKQVKQELPELEERFRMHQIELNKKLEIEKQIQNDRLNSELKKKKLTLHEKIEAYKSGSLPYATVSLSSNSTRRLLQESCKLRSKENDIREFEKRFQEEEKEKRYQEFKRKKVRSKKSTEAIPIAVAVPILVVENVA